MATENGQHGIGVDMLANDSREFRDGVVEMVSQIQTYGADIVGIACNTAHIYIDDIKLQPNTQFINLIQEVADKTKKYGAVKFGVLSSSGTRKQKLYHKYLDLAAADYQEASSAQQKLLDQTIDLVMAHKEIQAAEPLNQVMRQMFESGISHFILGCTELPIAYSAIDSYARTEYNVIDANWILAKSLVDKYYQKQI
ncbi:MAG: aspartate/glutamate racemase family protein [Candidatus Nomurabacteria bacterium]|jgi:aspartate racemase|nr:aspartate/glutamate racemase family protein [Candidatus Nomurabacteria bacterium]